MWEARGLRKNPPHVRCLSMGSPGGHGRATRRWFLWAVMLSVACVAQGQGARTQNATSADPRAFQPYDTRARAGLLAGDAASDSLREALRESCRAAGLEGDARLAQLALSIAQDSPSGARAPSATEVSFHAHRLGLVEPTPQLWVASAPDVQAIARSLRAAVADAARTDPLTHCGGAAVHVGQGVLVAVALSQRLVSLERPIPRALTRDQTVVLAGRLAKGYVATQLAITQPDGDVRRSALDAGRTFSRPLRFERPGQYSVELLAEGPQGVSVIAILELSVDVPPPGAPRAEVESSEADPAQVARKLAALIAQERERKGLPALAHADALEAVALSHSADMRDHHFVAHVSKRTGSARDRAQRAGLHPLVLLENIGRGYSAQEIHQGLMQSPGHRANILNRDVRLLGVGVTSEVEGSRLAFLATELFARLPESVDIETAPARLYQAISERRNAEKQAKAALDGALSRAAQKAAQGYAKGVYASDQAALDAATRDLKRLPRGASAITAALVKADDLTQVAETPELQDPKLRALGIGAARLPPGSSHTLVIVLIVALSGGG